MAMKRDKFSTEAESVNQKYPARPLTNVGLWKSSFCVERKVGIYSEDILRSGLLITRSPECNSLELMEASVPKTPPLAFSARALPTCRRERPDQSPNSSVTIHLKMSNINVVKLAQTRATFLWKNGPVFYARKMVHKALQEYHFTNLFLAFSVCF